MTITVEITLWPDTTEKQTIALLEKIGKDARVLSVEVVSE